MSDKSKPPQPLPASSEETRPAPLGGFRLGAFREIAQEMRDAVNSRAAFDPSALCTILLDFAEEVNDAADELETLAAAALRASGPPPAPLHDSYDGLSDAESLWRIGRLLHIAAERRDANGEAAIMSLIRDLNAIADRLDRRASGPETPTAPQWMIAFKRDVEPVAIMFGTREEMLALYERLAVQWTGVVLARVEVPDANAVEGGVARQAFNALRSASRVAEPAPSTASDYEPFEADLATPLTTEDAAELGRMVRDFVPSRLRNPAPPTASEWSNAACPEHGVHCGGVDCCCADKHLPVAPPTPETTKSVWACERCDDIVQNNAVNMRYAVDGVLTCTRCNRPLTLYRAAPPPSSPSGDVLTDEEADKIIGELKRLARFYEAVDLLTPCDSLSASHRSLSAEVERLRAKVADLETDIKERSKVGAAQLRASLAASRTGESETNG